ncbi:pentapeptide repeat-containing protein [Legionella brunensis]|uniref:Pentapeptide repeats (8 copies) n=1 Tax=Legionella brunensis TaxID=29422 RepID=A0A0W0SET9_9GAMM|nr:pentapeptide repeat-containing protein [Legionella brunensis]KTC81620.1 Pentapeptide repeats (8 copies) [Legionella brunensis]
MPSKSSRDEALEISSKCLDKTAKAFRLDSTNIKPITKNLYSDKITISPTFFANNSRKRNLDAILLQTSHEISKQQLNKKRNNELFTENYYNMSSFNPRTQDHIDAMISAEVSSGNCGELAFFTAIIAKELGYTGSVECIGFQKYDHVFVVLNRPKNSNPNDPSTWGKDTIIIDPWLKTSFPADRFNDFWLKHIDLVKFKSGLSTKQKLTKTTDLATEIERKAKYFSRLYTNSTGPRIPNALVHSDIVGGLNADDAFRLFKYFEKLYGADYLQKSILTPENRLKILQDLSYENYSSFILQRLCANSYKEKYQANTASSLEVILFALTTDDITLISSTRLQKAIHEMESMLNNDSINSLSSTVQLLSELESGQPESIVRSNIVDILLNALPSRFFPPSKLFLDNVNVENRDLKEIKLVECSLKNANLAHCNLENSDLHGTVLTGANLKGAHLQNAVLRDANLCHANLKDIVFDNNTNFYNAKFLEEAAFVNRVAFETALDELIQHTSFEPHDENLAVAIATDIDKQLKELSLIHPELANELRMRAIQHPLFSKCQSEQIKAVMQSDEPSDYEESDNDSMRFI